MAIHCVAVFLWWGYIAKRDCTPTQWLGQSGIAVLSNHLSCSSATFSIIQEQCFRPHRRHTSYSLRLGASSIHLHPRVPCRQYPCELVSVEPAVEGVEVHVKDHVHRQI